MLIYRIISIILYPFLELYLLYRVYKKKEDKHRLQERLGKASISRPQGQLIWIHAVSVGEANSAMILVEELLKSFPKISILFTTTTLTSALIINEKLPKFEGRVVHQFLPIDSYFCVQDFIGFWKMNLAIFVESEIWPNLIYETNRLKIPTFLVNARISEKSFKRWNLARKSGLNVFDYFDAIFVQMNEDQERFSKLTNGEILFYGNLKSKANNLVVDNEKLQKLKSQIGDRKIWLAASTHSGEELIIIEAHKKLKIEFPNLLTIIAPRHPNRGEEIKLLFDDIKFAQRSKLQDIDNSTQIYLADSLGELGIFYSLVDFAFIGGSLVDVGGHNPFEAIGLGCTIISGRKVTNFKEIYSKLLKEKGCIMIENQEQLVVAARRFLSCSQTRDLINNAAKKVVENSSDVVKNIIDRVGVGL